MKTFLILLSVLFAFSCSYKNERIKNEFLGKHKVNIKFSNSELIEIIGTREIYIELNENDSFRIYSATESCVSNIKGKWKVKSDLERAFFEFIPEGGNPHKSSDVSIIVECNGKRGMLNFND